MIRHPRRSRRRIGIFDWFRDDPLTAALAWLCVILWIAFAAMLWVVAYLGFL